MAYLEAEGGEVIELYNPREEYWLTTTSPTTYVECCTSARRGTREDSNTDENSKRYQKLREHQRNGRYSGLPTGLHRCQPRR